MAPLQAAATTDGVRRGDRQVIGFPLAESAGERRKLAAGHVTGKARLFP